VEGVGVLEAEDSCSLQRKKRPVRGETWQRPSAVAYAKAKHSEKVPGARGQQRSPVKSKVSCRKSQ